MTPELVNLPEDSEALKAMVRSLLVQCDREQRRAEEQQQRAEEQQRRAEDLRVEMLRLQLELERFKKWYCGISSKSIIVFTRRRSPFSAKAIGVFTESDHCFHGIPISRSGS